MGTKRSIWCWFWVLVMEWFLNGIGGSRHVGKVSLLSCFMLKISFQIDEFLMQFYKRIRTFSGMHEWADTFVLSSRLSSIFNVRSSSLMGWFKMVSSSTILWHSTCNRWLTVPLVRKWNSLFNWLSLPWKG